ncbi:MAG: hypothetical protein M0Z67_15425 [Nitrospiraceae bacterium]|nr:hypothetical protein [Nitrospiraceae bacterium]
MNTIVLVMCPHLKGSKEGTMCRVTNNLIKNMEGATIKWCMSRRHEACPVYMRSLQNMIAFGAYSVHCK